MGGCAKRAGPAVVALIFVVAACSSRGPLPSEEVGLSGYTCCNLRYDLGKDWISDSNYTNNPMIPAGFPIKVARDHRRYWARGEIGGIPVRLGQDYGHTAESFDDWARRLVVAEDPKKRIATWPPDVQRAIQMGKILKGMTREQVIVAINYPLKSLTPDLGSAKWRYWQASEEEFEIEWRNDRVDTVRCLCAGDVKLKVLMEDGPSR